MNTTFAYKAKKPGGGTISGSVSATNQSDAVSELRRQGLTVISLNAKKGGGGAKGGEKSGFFSLSIGGGAVKFYRLPRAG